jgi:hypothetical protein
MKYLKRAKPLVATKTHRLTYRLSKSTVSEYSNGTNSKKNLKTLKEILFVAPYRWHVVLGC